MTPRIWRKALISGIMMLPSKAVVAGMPSLQLTEVATLRLEVISFFLLGLLVSAAVVQWIWNAFSRDFPSLPRLSFGRAVGATVLWGLLFIIVLTMISGARELMTPGAWQRVGFTYKLTDQSAAKSSAVATDSESLMSRRRRKLELLSRELLRYAAAHEGSYPEQSQHQVAVPAEFWDLPGLEGTRYMYVPGKTVSSGNLPVAYEPTVYDSAPLVLLANGDVVQMRLESILDLVSATQ